MNNNNNNNEIVFFLFHAVCITRNPFYAVFPGNTFYTNHNSNTTLNRRRDEAPRTLRTVCPMGSHGVIELVDSEVVLAEDLVHLGEKVLR